MNKLIDYIIANSDTFLGTHSHTLDLWAIDSPNLRSGQAIILTRGKYALSVFVQHVYASSVTVHVSLVPRTRAL